MNSNALEPQDHGLEITSLAASIPIGDSTRGGAMDIKMVWQNLGAAGTRIEAQ